MLRTQESLPVKDYSPVEFILNHWSRLKHQERRLDRGFKNSNLTSVVIYFFFILLNPINQIIMALTANEITITTMALDIIRDNNITIERKWTFFNASPDNFKDLILQTLGFDSKSITTKEEFINLINQL